MRGCLGWCWRGLTAPDGCAIPPREYFEKNEIYSHSMVPGGFEVMS